MSNARMQSEVIASIIVATRNRAHYLRDCLRSLSAQTCDRSFEILVIDNGSTDDTPQLLEEWCRVDSRCRTFRETRVGLSVAKNAGAMLAKGRLLLFTDDDVLVDPQWIRAYLDLFARIGEENALAGGKIVPIPNDLGPWPKWFDDQALPDVGLLSYNAERRLRTTEYVWGANMAIPSHLFWKVGPWNEDLGRRGDQRGTFEDTEYQDRVKKIGGAVWFCPQAVLRHRVEPEVFRLEQLMQTAFTRGRSFFWMPVLTSNRKMQEAPKKSLGASLALLTLNLCSWLGWTILFQFARNRAVFRWTHRAAFSSGKSMERMRAGRHLTRLCRDLCRGAFLMRHVALRLVSQVRD